MDVDNNPFDGGLHVLPQFFTSVKVPLTGPDVPAGMVRYSPCVPYYHTDMHIFSTIYPTLPTWDAPKPSFFYLIPAPTNSSQGYFLDIFIVPAENNPFLKTSYIKYDKLTNAWTTKERNPHVIAQNYTDVRLSTSMQVTEVLRDDLWGLFGVMNKTGTEYRVKSEAETLFNPGFTVIGLNLPLSEIRNRQVLILSIPEAFSSWGGAFSIVLTVFGALFGHGQYSPFGVIQKVLLRASTKANLGRVYGNWRKDNYSSSLSTLEGDSTPKEPPHAPRPIATGDIKSEYNSNSNSPGRSDGPYHHQQQQQNQPQDVVNLREDFVALRQEMDIQIKAGILHYIQRHEQRFKDMESLLSEFYLDMDLVDTDEHLARANASSNKTSSSSLSSSGLPFTTAKTDSLSGGQDVRQRTGWSQRLFNTEPTATSAHAGGFQEAPREETVGLRGAGYGMGVYDQNQSDYSSPYASRVPAPYRDDPAFEMRPI
ncbi:hypothetical protein BGZ88_002880 [Linnemannia elongata]|uniref:Uncharacterized protein n=1 Tax=Linnemannia elongata AG-77 TaxID=1314771 RepID=A0A197JAY8_9FUNG|nr:hypothetical protein BGZ88_002880 [Linnemannia elongata]KAK5809395.1 hypothetical protein F5H01DRAFT_394999 [Linnemannia elongata]OAQ22277.1 hypothetical protein K457DRAFT_26204 [Linnemannia elongata AG-77]